MLFKSVFIIAQCKSDLIPSCWPSYGPWGHAINQWLQLHLETCLLELGMNKPLLLLLPAMICCTLSTQAPTQSDLLDTRSHTFWTFVGCGVFTLVYSNWQWSYRYCAIRNSRTLKLLFGGTHEPVISGAVLYKESVNTSHLAVWPCHHQPAYWLEVNSPEPVTTGANSLSYATRLSNE